MFGIVGREASNKFLGMTEHPSRPAQLSGDGDQISNIQNVKWYKERHPGSGKQMREIHTIC